MGHKIELSMEHARAEGLRDLGRTLSGDHSLGINQAAHWLLDAVVDGKFQFTPHKRKPASQAAKKEEG